MRDFSLDIKYYIYKTVILSSALPAANMILLHICKTFGHHTLSCSL